MLITWINHYLKHYSGLSKPVFYILLLQFFDSIIISICYFLPLFFVNQLKFDIVLASYVIAFFSLGTVFGGIIGGKIADKITPVKTVIISLILQGLAFLCLAYIRFSYALMLDLLILGIATYSFNTANFLWALSYCGQDPQQKLKVITLLDTSSNLGLGISALFIGLFITKSLFFLAIFSGISLLMISINLLKLKNENFIHISPPENNMQEFEITESHSKLLMCYVLFSLFLSGLIISQLGSTYSIYLHELFPQKQFSGFGLLFALNTFLIVVAQTPLANYCYRFNRIFIIGIGVFLLGSGMCMLSFSISYLLAMLACIIYTIGEMLFFSVAQLTYYENTPVSKKGFFLGIYRMIYASSRVLGPAAGGYIYQQFGSTTLWNLCGIIGLICFLTAIYFYHYSRINRQSTLSRHPADKPRHTETGIIDNTP